jgi:uncharacterized protein YceK
MNLTRPLVYSALACALLTSGCASVLSSTPRSVSVRAPESRVANADKLGEKECQRYGKHAKRQENLPKYLKEYYVYDCVS